MNVEEEYHEQTSDADAGQITHKDRGGDRLVPQRIEVNQALDAVKTAYARYDPVALGGAIGLVFGTTLFLATAFLLLRGGENVGAHLSLLGNYLLGFEVSWAGALIGWVEATIGGFVFGYLLASAINVTVEIHKNSLIRRLEAMALIDGFEQEIK